MVEAIPYHCYGYTVGIETVSYNEFHRGVKKIWHTTGIFIYEVDQYEYPINKWLVSQIDSNDKQKIQEAYHGFTNRLAHYAGQLDSFLFEVTPPHDGYTFLGRYEVGPNERTYLISCRQHVTLGFEIRIFEHDKNGKRLQGRVKAHFSNDQTNIAYQATIDLSELVQKLGSRWGDYPMMELSQEHEEYKKKTAEKKKRDREEKEMKEKKEREEKEMKEKEMKEKQRKKDIEIAQERELNERWYKAMKESMEIEKVKNEMLQKSRTQTEYLVGYSSVQYGNASYYSKQLF